MPNDIYFWSYNVTLEIIKFRIRRKSHSFLTFYWVKLIHGRLALVFDNFESVPDSKFKNRWNLLTLPHFFAFALKLSVITEAYHCLIICSFWIYTHTHTHTHTHAHIYIYIYINYKGLDFRWIFSMWATSCDFFYESRFKGAGILEWVGT